MQFLHELFDGTRIARGRSHVHIHSKKDVSDESDDSTVHRPCIGWCYGGFFRATLKGAGYNQITNNEADDGHWEGEGTKADGKRYEFQVDPHDGKIVRDELDS